MPPKGHLADLSFILRLLQDRFNEIYITLKARNGEISEQEFDDKVKEAFRQLGVEVREWDDD